ncbi:MAG: nucleotidyltransferase domain-containing protein [Ruminococcus sp.]|nr:nucleotidyltransferase domain-containing protein [Ruminococcus sp.]
MCTQNTLKTVLDRVCDYSRMILADRLYAVKLYGSYARGDYDDESDIDVMVIADISPDERSEIRKKLFDFTYDLNLKYNVLLSVYIQDKDTYETYKGSYPFFKNIEQEGVDLVA